MEPISAVGLVAAVFQLGSEVTKLCISYTQGVKNANKELDFVLGEINLFQKALFKLKGMLHEEEDRQDTLGQEKLAFLRETLCGNTEYLPSCKVELEKLIAKLEKTKSSTPLKAAVYRIAWPFREDEISRIMNRLRNVAETINRAVDMDMLELTQNIDATTKKIIAATKEIESRTKAMSLATQNIAEGQQKSLDQKVKEDKKKALEVDRQKVIEWLTHPDQAENHNIACKARNDGAKTGRWFLDSVKFREFRTVGKVLWLHGPSGCGKTILTSAVIDELIALRRGDTRMEVAYWYISSSVKKRQSLDNLVRALHTQLMPLNSIPDALHSMWKEKSGKEAPKTSDLIKALYAMFAEEPNRSYFIIVDAVDEADSEDREELLSILKAICGLEGVRPHILIISRTNLTSVEREMRSITQFYNISVEREHVDHDIQAHVSERLRNDNVLKRWNEPERELIKSSLMQNAAGMFRWVDCQLQAIKRCGKKKQLQKTLATLPKDLDEQYTRDLAQIDESDAEDALKLLQWLAFPQRKIRVEEAAHMIAVDFDEDPPTFDPGLKLEVPERLLELCSGMVRPDINTDGRDELGAPAEVRTLTTAHATVLDFLKKEPVKIGPLEPFRFRRGAVNMRMAETCLAYLRYFGDEKIELDETNIREFPFARLCAEFWDDHYRECLASDNEDLDRSRLEEMALDLLQSPESMLRLIKLCDPDNDTDRADFTKSSKDIRPALYYASLLGLPTMARRLIDQGVDVDENVEGGCGTALVAAAKNGRKEIVEILLQEGADPTKAGNTNWGTPLAAAVEMDHLEIVKILAKQKGVKLNSRRNVTVLMNQNNDNRNLDFNAEDIELEERDPTPNNFDFIRSAQSMIYIATAHNSPNTFNWLLENDVNPNMRGGYYGSALATACRWDQVGFAMALLEHGASPTISGGWYGFPLQAACHHGLVDVVKRMLSHNADVRCTGGYYHSSLIAATAWGREEVVDLLLKSGARDNLYGGEFADSALQAASAGGYPSITRKLIASGSEVNRKAGQWWTPLHAACVNGHLEVVKILLENGADPNIQGCGSNDNALQKACEGGHEAIVRELITHDADINLRGGHFDNALQAACYSRNTRLVKYLLEQHADPCLEGGSFENTMQAAITCCTVDVVEALLDYGMSPNMKGGLYTWPIIRAATGTDDSNKEQEHAERILCLLLKRGADPNLEREGDDYYARVFRTALQHAPSPGLTKLLIEAGADVDADKGEYGTALHAAICMMWKQSGIVKVLLDHGANVNANNWHQGTPLTLAASEADEVTPDVELLIRHGADLESSNMMGQTPIMNAVKGGNKTMFSYLRAKGANLRAIDNRGCYLIHYASTAASSFFLDELLKEETDFNVTDGQGWTPLHWASASGYNSIATVETLVKAGAKSDVEDHHGWTPVKLAQQFDRGRAAMILIKGASNASSDMGQEESAHRMRDNGYTCDGCGQAFLEMRELIGPERLHHCTVCASFDFCFRCYLDVDVIHPKDHSFVKDFRYTKPSDEST